VFSKNFGHSNDYWGYLRSIIAVLRVQHWVKNTVLLIPIFYLDRDLPKLPTVILAVVAFSLASSAGYIVNDYIDRFSDATHPIKSKRPVATGKVSSLTLKVLFLASLFFSLSLSLEIGQDFFRTVSAYLVLTYLYTFFLKRNNILRLIILPFFFILRLCAGVTFTSGNLSIWLFILAYLLLVGLAYLKCKTDAIDYNLNSKDWQSYQVSKLPKMYLLIFYVAIIFIVCTLFYTDLVSVAILRNPVLIFVSVFQILSIYVLIYHQAIFKRKSKELINLSITNPTILVFVLLALLISWKTRF